VFRLVCQLFKYLTAIYEIVRKLSEDLSFKVAVNWEHYGASVLDGWMDGCMDGWMDEQTYELMNEWMNE
jgi:hypothetical protein